MSQSICLQESGVVVFLMAFLQEAHLLVWMGGPGLRSTSPACKINDRSTVAGSCAPVAKNTGLVECVYTDCWDFLWSRGLSVEVFPCVGRIRNPSRR